MEKKTITISNDLAFLNKSSKSKKKKEKTNKFIKPNKVKEELLNKIKEKALNEREKQKKNSESVSNNSDKEENFSEHINFLKSISEKQKQKKRKTRNKKIKENHNLIPENPNKNPYYNQSSPNVPNFKMTSSFTNPTTPFPSLNNYNNQSNYEPPYGNLKNGSKPTYKTWKRETQKKPFHFEGKTKNNNNNIIINTNNENIDVNNLLSSREEKLEKLKKKHVNKNNKIKHSFGKSKTKKKINVFIKNSNTRKKIKDEIEKLKEKPISEIKLYLKEKSFIKAGSEAPNDVLRKTYEQLYLAGDIKNKNSSVLVHNYVSKES